MAIKLLEQSVVERDSESHQFGHGGPPDSTNLFLIARRHHRVNHEPPSTCATMSAAVALADTNQLGQLLGVWRHSFCHHGLSVQEQRASVSQRLSHEAQSMPEVMI
jgi:hypothetical protein